MKQIMQSSFAKKKYGMSARLIGLFTSQKGNIIVYSVKPID